MCQIIENEVMSVLWRKKKKTILMRTGMSSVNFCMSIDSGLCF